MSKIRINTEARIKLFLSIILLIYAVVVGVLKGNVAVVIAMLFSFSGDVFLLDSRGCLSGKKENTFMHGVLAFTMSHLWYIMAMNTQISNELICLVFSFIILALFKIGNSNKLMHVIYFLYAGVIILNTINVFFYGGIAIVGMMLFIISDSILIVCKIREKRSLLDHIAIWMTYVLAQICLLTSILMN